MWVALINLKSDTYKLVNKLKREAINDNFTFSSKFNLEVQNDFKTLPIIYWLLKIGKTSTRAKCIVTSKKCSAKALSDSNIKAFQLTLKQIQSFHEK